MRWTPHALIEGCAIAAYAIGAERCYIYIRGEFTEPWTVMAAAVEEAYARGALGANALGSGKRIDMILHRGAGAYICGEETAMMNSIEGKRGNPRIKPPFPAVAGLFGMPTTINNVETLSAVPHILNRGAAWYKALCLGNPKSTGTKLISICGHVQRPGNYEVTMGTPLKEILYDMAGGPKPGRTFKAIIPGGSSVPIMTREEAEAALFDYEGIVEKGSMLGSAGMIVMDDTTDMVYQIWRLAQILRPRELRPVHPVPRGHGVDHEDPGADPGREGEAGGLPAPPRPVRQHDRQDHLRAERFVRGAGRERDPEVPVRVRGLHRRGARAGAGGGVSAGDQLEEDEWPTNWST